MKTINKTKKKKNITVKYLEDRAKALVAEQFDEDTVPVNMADVVLFLADLVSYLKKEKGDDKHIRRTQKTSQG